MLGSSYLMAGAPSGLNKQEPRKQSESPKGGRPAGSLGHLDQTSHTCFFSN